MYLDVFHYGGTPQVLFLKPKFPTVISQSQKYNTFLKECRSSTMKVESSGDFSLRKDCEGFPVLHAFIAEISFQEKC